MWKLDVLCKFIEFNILICIYKIIDAYISSIGWFLLTMLQVQRKTFFPPLRQLHWMMESIYKYTYMYTACMYVCMKPASAKSNYKTWPIQVPFICSTTLPDLLLLSWVRRLAKVGTHFCCRDRLQTALGFVRVPIFTLFRRKQKHMLSFRSSRRTVFSLGMSELINLRLTSNAV